MVHRYLKAIFPGLYARMFPYASFIGSCSQVALGNALSAAVELPHAGRANGRSFFLGACEVQLRGSLRAQVQLGHEEKGISRAKNAKDAKG
jgi:hypothetical protein